VVKRFKENSSGRFKPDEFRKVAEGLVNYLNHKYQEELQENSRDASKIKVEWHDSYSYCNINSSKLILTTSIFEDWERVPYQREKPFADKYAKTREEMAIWKVIHEWSHLFQGCHKHASPLWSRIDSVAAQEPWLWS
jgi:hypothetical protein